MSEQSVFIELPSVSMQRIYKIIREVGRSKIPFLLPVKPVLVKKGWQDIFTKTVHDATNLLFLSTVADCPQNSYKVNSLGMRQGHLQAQSISDTVRMNQNQILRAVAQKRIQRYSTLQKAAASLGIDTRTLQKYAEWQE